MQMQVSSSGTLSFRIFLHNFKYNLYLIIKNMSKR